jgi:hypothetical protein
MFLNMNRLLSAILHQRSGLGTPAVVLSALLLITISHPDTARATTYSSTSIGSFGSGNGQFNSPTSTVADSSGNIWVVDTGNSRIQQLTSLGSFASNSIHRALLPSTRLAIFGSSTRGTTA